jgi:hypothetical protein
MIWNHITGLKVKDSTLVAQFSELKSYGGQASFDWATVFDSVCFEDPNGRFTEIRHIIESAAEVLKLELHVRAEEKDWQPGSAAKAKSQNKRVKFRSRVKLLARQKQAKARKIYSADAEPVHLQKLGGHTLKDDTDFEYLTEIEIDTELSAQSSPPSNFSADLDGKLAFRVWDAKSRGFFSEEHGFVSEAHRLWRGPYLPPFDPETEQGRKAVAFLTNSHLCMSGGASACKHFCHEP